MRLRLSVVLCMLFAVPLFADIYHFSLTDGPHTVTFNLPDNPTPDFADGSYGFSFFSLPMMHDGKAVDCSVDFWNAASSGGLTIYNGGCGGVLMDSIGDVLYTGPETNPQFVLGTFTLQDLGDSSQHGPFLLTVTDTAGMPATPEPAALALLASGSIGLLMLRRKRLL